MDNPETDQITEPEDSRRKHGPERYIVVTLVVLAAVVVAALVAFAG